MLLPLSVDNPLRRHPLVNYALVAANILVYAFVYPYGPEAAAMEAKFALYTPPSPLFHSHQLLTYAFLHSGWAHVVGNMLILWIFGNNLNDRLGHLGYLVFYLAAAAASGLGQILASQPPSFCVGASGAVFAVLGGYLVLYPLNDVRLFYWIIIRIGIAYVSAWWIAGLWIAENIIMSVLSPESGIAYAAHLIGFGMGIGTVLFLITTGLLKREGIDVISWVTHKLPDGRRWTKDFIPIESGAPPLATERRPEKVIQRGEIPGLAMPGFVDTDDVMRHELLHAVGVGDMENALTLYEHHAVADPDGVLPLRALITVGNWYLRSNRFSEAFEVWRRAGAQHPDNPMIPALRFSMGMVLSRHLDRPEAALSHLSAALDGLSNADQARMARREIARLRRAR